ncbi:ADP-ribosylglycohydrolase family protein (plasmid) [Deinococcus metallilatus]|nr:ADP-ribosylglycohydrolase family protein [Deinococcus metallilatus]RXJ18154.1 ADP-ribosylglycohydrolase family protein [Deinococcus metallilatus]TLK32360.1 ADP-ribosylglycohydrolase family protein [Deinococcus metallilatus]
MIGVYLGRPIEGWTHARIVERFGEVRDYVHEAQGRPLIVSDDDLSGTFAFVRAIEEHGPHLGSREIGLTWLNQIVEGRSILWWGGMGNSTEETAYIRLKSGIPAPQSGSIALNGRPAAEQIGAQIFIDGWAMLAPNNPELAARLARAAAQVSHDGEAVDAAVALAVMEALAFTRRPLEELLDAAQATLPPEGTLARLYRDVRQWHATLPNWRDAFAELEKYYGYHLYPGNVHVIPNHGVILLSLLYGGGDFEETLVICNTCGWDTDCNVGNVGALMGLLCGLNAIPERWREPVADRLFVCSAEGSRAVTDAVQVTDNLVRLAHVLHGLPLPERPPRYHFRLPGSVQGFQGEGVEVQPYPDGLHLTVNGAGRATVATFLPPEVPNPHDTPYTRNLGQGWNYTLLASPTLHPGQRVTARVRVDAPLTVAWTLDHYDAEDQPVTLNAEATLLQPGTHDLTWTVPDLRALPVARIGLQLEGAGTLILRHLDWQGVPTLQLTRPPGAGQMWRRAWINAAGRIDIKSPGLMRFSQHEGVGQLLLDARDWTSLRLRAVMSAQLPAPLGLAVHTRGLRRHYALWVRPGLVELVRQRDAERVVLAQAPSLWEPGERLELCLTVVEGSLQARVGRAMLEARDPNPLPPGGVAVLCEANGVDVWEVQVQPI